MAFCDLLRSKSAAGSISICQYFVYYTYINVYYRVTFYICNTCDVDSENNRARTLSCMSSAWRAGLFTLSLTVVKHASPENGGSSFEKAAWPRGVTLRGTRILLER